MNRKITLITPPDFFENSNKSILFMHLKDSDQDAASKWLANNDDKGDVNFYVYSGEDDIRWLLWATGHCQYKYIDLDEIGEISSKLCGYLLGKSNFYYKTTNENSSAIYSYINCHKVNSIEEFLEEALLNYKKVSNEQK